MRNQLQVLNLFLASPGDLVEERKIARSVVDELNNSIGRPLGWRVELYGWEDSPIGIVRPQSQINEEVNQCDLFVGLLWERWGQPPGESKYQSGFEEEIELAMARWSRDGQPQIWLFLKEIDPKLLKYPGDQIKLVLAFRQRIASEKRLFYKEFSDTDEWTAEFRKRLSNYLVSLAATRGQPPSTSVSPERQLELKPTKVKPKDSTAQPPSDSVQQAMDSLAAALEAVRLGNLDKFRAQSISEAILARLMLITATFEASRIGGELLKVHQANIIYRFRSEIVVTKSEWLLLLRTMLANRSQNIPGWGWFSAPALKPLFSTIAATDESEEVILGTLRIFRELSIVPSPRDRRRILRKLIQLKNEDCLVEALHFLEVHGQKSDQWFVAECKALQSNTVRAAASDAIIAVLTRHDVEEAVKELTTTDQRLSESVV